MMQQSSDKEDFKQKNWQRRIWLFTYYPAGTYMTPDILKTVGLDSDECHSTTDTVINYTYVHLTKKVQQVAIEKNMKKLEKSHGIVQASIFGYEPIAGLTLSPESPVQDHVVFQMLLRHYNENSPLFQASTDGEPVLKRGHLFRAINPGQTIKPEYQTKKQLVSIVGELRHQNEELKQKLTETKEESINSSNYGQGPKGKPPSTRSILYAYRRDHDARKAMKRVIKQEKRMKKKEDQGDGSGEIYAASNPLTMGLHKQGFSFGDAETRVRGLQTAGVLEPFKLVRRAKVPDARLYEKAMHIYFKDVRVYKRKEFFATSNEEVNQFFDMVEADGGDDEQWACAIAKAKKARK